MQTQSNQGSVTFLNLLYVCRTTISEGILKITTNMPRFRVQIKGLKLMNTDRLMGLLNAPTQSWLSKTAVDILHTWRRAGVGFGYKLSTVSCSWRYILWFLSVAEVLLSVGKMWHSSPLTRLGKLCGRHNHNPQFFRSWDRQYIPVLHPVSLWTLCAPGVA
jgi:hypothetical protein